MVSRKIAIRLGHLPTNGNATLCSLPFAILNPQFRIEISQGGIAQLVERQLCKLEVRGSNPLASIFRSRRLGRAKIVDGKPWEKRISEDVIGNL